MKSQFKHSSSEIQQLQKLKLEIQYLRGQLLDIDEKIASIKQNYPKFGIKEGEANSQQFPPDNDSENESLDELQIIEGVETQLKAQ
ncbi:MAG: hypothetical protein WBF90_20010 [Rivularia sp. (in: cyanobacteria)]|jgi:hypothetical protein